MNIKSLNKQHNIPEMLSDFCLRMKMSGYPARCRETIIASALKAWEEDKTGIKPITGTGAGGRRKEERRRRRKKSAGTRNLVEGAVTSPCFVQLPLEAA